MELCIFLDESGDLGFSPKSSRFFLLGGIITSRPFQIQRIPKKIRQKLHKNLKNIPELKATKCDHTIHKKILEEIVKCDETEIIFIACQKSFISYKIRKSPDKEMQIYEYLLTKLMNVIPKSLIIQSHAINITIDDHWKNPKRRKILQELLENSLVIQSIFQGKALTINQINSISSNELQVVDFVTNTCYRAFERGDITNFCYLVKNIDIFSA